MSSEDTYQNPLTSRYASPEMSAAFSDQTKFSTWRSLWIALAEAERELGLPITAEQVEELRSHRDDVNYDVAREREREVRNALPRRARVTSSRSPRRVVAPRAARPPSGS